MLSNLDVDDTRHISSEQYEDLKNQLDDFFSNFINQTILAENYDSFLDETITTILGILCLEKPV